MEIDEKLLEFYALLLAYGRNFNAIPDAELAERGFTRDQARAALNRQDFPWGELDAELARGEALDKIAHQYGMTLEQVVEIRRQLQDPNAS